MISILHRESAILLLAGLLSVPSTAWAETRHLTLPSYQVNAGDVLEVPLTLDNAAGLAALRVQVNFDPEVLELEAVTNGPLGEDFELTHGEDDGYVQLTFARAEVLAGGSGRLASLKFRANSGAAVDLVSELAIADLSLSDATGVIDVRQKDTLTLTNGEVAVSVSQNIDNAGNGLPDWWEELHGLDLFTDNGPLDPEQDGLPNLLEYAFGGNPKVPDAHLRGVHSDKVEVNGADFMRLGFFRRHGDASLLFKVEESPDLSQWLDLPLPQQLIGAPQDMGDGTEYVEVLGTLPITGAEAEPNGFMRVGVEKAE